MSVDFVFNGSAYTPPAPLPFNFAPATAYSYTGSGGAVTGGAALVSVSIDAPESGGAVTGGAADVRRVFAFTGSGGAAAGGEAGAQYSPMTHTSFQDGRDPHPGTVALMWAHEYKGQGGASVGGGAAVAFRPAPEPVTHQHAPLANEGTIRTGGAASASFTDTIAIINAQDEELLLLGLFGSLAA